MKPNARVLRYVANDGRLVEVHGRAPESDYDRECAASGHRPPPERTDGSSAFVDAMKAEFDWLREPTPEQMVLLRCSNCGHEWLAPDDGKIRVCPLELKMLRGTATF